MLDYMSCFVVLMVFFFYPQQPKADPRAILLVAEPQLCISFIKALFGALYEVFNSMVSG